MKHYSNKCIDLVKEFEGVQFKVYKDPVGIKTAGVGHTGTDVNAMRVGQKVAEQQVNDWLKKDLDKALLNVLSFDKKYNWSQSELDALVSFAFNIGSINQLTAEGTRNKKEIAKKMLLYTKAGGKELPGLVRRRKAEQTLFLSGNVVTSSAYVTVNAISGLNIRKEPTINATVLTAVKNGTRLEYIDHANDDWDKIRYNGIVGFVSRRYVR